MGDGGRGPGVATHLEHRPSGAPHGPVAEHEGGKAEDAGDILEGVVGLDPHAARLERAVVVVSHVQDAAKEIAVGNIAAAVKQLVSVAVVLRIVRPVGARDALESDGEGLSKSKFGIGQFTPLGNLEVR